MNGGNHTRANTEDVLIATRGAGLERKHAGIKQVVYSPSARTARNRGKFATVWAALRRRARIELFSRSAAPGWSHWGNQCATASVELIPAAPSTF
jgi:N6-adenosine-specific RNA methylase IME4